MDSRATEPPEHSGPPERERAQSDGAESAATFGGPGPPLQRPLFLALQRSAGNAAVQRLLRDRPGAVSGLRRQTGAPPETGPRARLVEDDREPGPGQMKKGEFLDELRTAACETAEEALAWSLLRVAGCPWIDHWIRHYEGRDAEHVERAIRLYAPDAAGTPDARAAIPIICARLRQGIVNWRETGEIPTDVRPADEGAPPAGPPGGPGQPGLARKPDGSAVKRGDPAEIQAELGPGRPLDPAVRSGIGRAFGADTGRVRVHADAAGASLSARLGARAFTVGEHVAFAAGEYQPGTLFGDALIAHELAHVVQQRAGMALGSASGSRGEEADLEQDADISAARAVASGSYGGLTSLARVAGPRLRSGLRLQRCPDSAPTPDAFVTELLRKARAGDKAGFSSDLRGLNGSRAGDTMVRHWLGVLRKEGALTQGEAFRAVALQELGPETGWAPIVRNFAEGVDGSQFTIGAGLPPAGADALRQFCAEQAGSAAEGGLTARGTHVVPPDQVKRDYRIRFDARWHLGRFAGFPAAFNPALDSKGPRNDRAREIFEELYAAEPALKAAYDDNVGGVREYCDLYAGPDPVNADASPRIQDLLALFSGAPIVAANNADPAYTAFVATVVPKAQALAAADRQEVERSRRWRLVIEQKVHGPTPAVSQQLAEEMRTTILNARAPAPPGPVAPPPAPAPAAVVIPTPAQRAFLNGITLAAPAGPLVLDTAQHDLVFTAQSAVPNPGLAIERHISVEPVDKVLSGQEDETPWPAGSASVPHTASVDVDGGAAGHTDFVARLNIRPLAAGVFAERTARVRVVDHRQQWLTANISPGIEFTRANQTFLWAVGTTISYHGGQVPLNIVPSLPAANPGLTIFMRGELKQNGAVIGAYPRTRFGSSDRTQLGSTIVLASTPPSAVADAMELKVEFFSDPAMAGPPLHTILQPFAIDPQPAAVLGGDDISLLAADNALLNQPKATAGSLLHHLASFPAGSLERRVLTAVEGGVFAVKACVVRSDSAAWLVGPPVRGNPATQVAYACGQLDDAHTLVGQAHAVGWQWQHSVFAGHVFLNATPDPQNPGAKRPVADLAEFLVHEGIHASDLQETDEFGRYQVEFRAYWTQGMAAAQSTAFDPSVPSDIGPRSRRANAIFQHLYHSSTYEWVKPAYDGNVLRFRERVDAYLYPDMINPLLAVHLADLRREIESFSGAGYAAKKAAIGALFAACDPAEKQEIAGNRVWRDLVERKFTGTVSTGWFSSEPQADQIKRVLKIPQ